MAFAEYVGRTSGIRQSIYQSHVFIVPEMGVWTSYQGQDTHCKFPPKMSSSTFGVFSPDPPRCILIHLLGVWSTAPNIKPEKKPISTQASGRDPFRVPNGSKARTHRNSPSTRTVPNAVSKRCGGLRSRPTHPFLRRTSAGSLNWQTGETVSG